VKLLDTVRARRPALKRETMPRAKKFAIVGLPALFVLAITGSASLGLIVAGLILAALYVPAWHVLPLGKWIVPLTVIVLANLNGPAAEALATKLAAMALNDTSVIIPSERRRVTLDTATLARYAGRYQINPNTVAEVTTEKGRVFLKMGNGPVNEIFSAGQNRFFRALPDGDLEFSGPAGAPADELLLPPESGNDVPTRAQRASPE